jgi:hypothetical protein
LSKNTLVLYVSGADEPIVLEGVEEIIMGRPIIEIPSERTLDLTNYGAVTLGVSRRHIRIRYANGMFKVADLDSTNGTQLNGHFLSPNQSQQLRPFDQLTLGQLRLMVYFEMKPDEQGINILLTDRRAPQPWGLTPEYLKTAVIPYIQSLADMQNIIHELRGKSVEDVQVIFIQACDRPAQLRLGLIIGHEVIDIVRQTIGPWQRIYADPALLNADTDDEELLPQLLDLVGQIAGGLSGSYPELDADTLRKKLLDPAGFIALSGLELILETSASA